MKKLVKELKRTVVAFLIISMTVTGVEMPVYASENNSRETVQNQKQINAKEEPKVIKELKNEKENFGNCTWYSNDTLNGRMWRN